MKNTAKKISGVALVLILVLTFGALAFTRVYADAAETNYQHNGMAFRFTDKFVYDCGNFSDQIIDRTTSAFYSPKVVSNVAFNSSKKLELLNDYADANTLTKSTITSWKANVSGQYRIVDHDVFVNNPTFGGFLIRDITTDTEVRYGPKMSNDLTAVPHQANFDPIEIIAGHDYVIFYTFMTSNNNKPNHIKNGTKTQFDITVDFEYYKPI
jgi:hypothetical protein